MAGERRLNWGADATDAQYRTGDDTANNRFIIVEDLDGGTVLLEYDETAGEFVSRGPVNMSGNDITNAGAIDAQSLSTAAVDTTPGYNWEKLAGSRSFDTWYQAPSNRDIWFTANAVANADGVNVTLQGHVNTSQTDNVIMREGNTSAAEFTRPSIPTLRVPAGQYYKIVSAGDTGNFSLEEWSEYR
jgi:hypothetical protein